MKIIKQLHLLIILVLSMALLPLNVHAIIAGHVILTKGNVTSVSATGENKQLKRRSKIMSGDIIKTGTNSSVQIRFVDKALMTIKANTEMDISQYHLANPAEGKKEQALMKLVKGGFRTISGQIGKGDKSAYKVDTPAASIGIRGTNYEVQQESNGDFVMAVYSGGISVQNESGSIELGLGGDFNFTRVSSKKAPKGLLIAPTTLSENSATDENTEEEESETADATTEGEEKEENTDEESADEENSDSQVAESDKAEENGTTTETEESADTNQVATTEGTAQESNSEVTSALDEKLSGAIKENEEQAKEELVELLIEGGYLAEGSDFDDISDDTKTDLVSIGDIALIEQAIGNEQPLNEVADAINPPETEAPVIDTTPFIESLYAGLASVTNPFPATHTKDGITYDLISDAEYNLAASDKLGIVAIPMNYSQNSSGDLSFNFGEANVSSPSDIITNSGVYTTALAASSAEITIYYEILNTTSNQTDEYRVVIPITVAVNTPVLLLTQIQNALSSSTPDVYLNGIQQTNFGPINDVLVTMNNIDASTHSFTFGASTSSETFMTTMELQFSGTDSEILANMLGGNNDGNDWYHQADIELMITSGAWEMSADGDGNPILVMMDSSTESIPNDEGTSTVATIDRQEVIKPHGGAVVTSSLLAFATCGDGGNICSIQVLKDDEKIRWGAWLSEPGKGIQIYEQKVDPDSAFIDSDIHEEDQILAFWLAAERADINALSGTAQFSSASLDCTDYSQCIGFADDGLVQKLSGQFDVNFNSGAITNGNLNIEVSDDISFGLFGPEQGTAVSTWDVNFSGQMETGKPEFTTHSVNGTIKDETGTDISNQIIGNLGGIFVAPGDKFAGGYNLGTADGTNKHTSGVFTLDKQP